MRKVMKFVLGFAAAIFIIIAVFWGSFVYVSDYKITKADTSVSPDGTYELVLQAVGEADFPFGSANNRGSESSIPEGHENQKCISK